MVVVGAGRRGRTGRAVGAVVEAHTRAEGAHGAGVLLGVARVVGAEEAARALRGREGAATYGVILVHELPACLVNSIVLFYIVLGKTSGDPGTKPKGRAQGTRQNTR